MRADVQRGGCSAEYRWRPLLNDVDQFAKSRSGAIWGGKKRGAVLSNYKAELANV